MTKATWADSEHSMGRHSRSFTAASRWLPADVRPDVELLYSFCRRVDDAIDATVGDTAQVVLDQKRLLETTYSGHPPADPLWEAFGELCRRRHIPILYPLELLAGMEMDTSAMVYRGMESLYTYAFRVAGVVGLMMCHVTGITDDDALIEAALLGIAMQLTNICRDIREDWGRGRLYVPEDVLRAAGVSELHRQLGGALPTHAHQPLQTATRMLLSQADLLYTQAMRGVSALDIQVGMAVRVAAVLYRAIGHNLRASGAHPLLPRATTTSLQKAKLGAFAIVAEVASRVFGPPKRAMTTRRIPEAVVSLRDILQTLEASLQLCVRSGATDTSTP